MIATKAGRLGENITVRRFARFKVGDTVAQAKLSAEE
jgi:elongation factor Ts